MFLIFLAYILYKHISDKLKKFLSVENSDYCMSQVCDQLSVSSVKVDPNVTESLISITIFYADAG